MTWPCRPAAFFSPKVSMAQSRLTRLSRDCGRQMTESLKGSAALRRYAAARGLRQLRSPCQWCSRRRRLEHEGPIALFSRCD